MSRKPRELGAGERNPAGNITPAENREA